MLFGFREQRRLESLKCRLLFGELEGQPVCLKALHHPDAIWHWYFEREAHMYAQLPAGAPVPRLHGTEPGVMILDWLPGEPLSAIRRVKEPLPDHIIDSCLSVADEINAWSLAHAPAPEAPIVRTMRRRLLEDPTSPMGWFLDGFERCEKLGIVSGSQRAQMTDALAAYPETATCHGDFLPRNIIRDRDRIAVCDWECAGLHARDWDRALLWANVPRENRERIEAAASDPDAFRTLCAFALAREIKFATRATQTRRDELQRDLNETLAR